jgi:hypothetical protein
MTLENATVLLDVYRSELTKAGHDEQAAQLRGLEIFDANGVETALLTLRDATPASEEADETRDYLIRVLESVSCDACAAA